MYAIVGSTAIHYNKLKFRPAKDLDIWTDDADLYETEQVRTGVDVKIIPTHILKMLRLNEGYCSADTVYTIKCSHLGWKNPMWSKHKVDIINLKSQGCELIPELYKALVEYWKVELGNKDFLNLKQDKDEFFTDNVPYVYDHDWLHEQVSYPNPPMYTNCLREGEDVMIDREKFDLMPFEDRVRMFREEVVAIAIERYIVNPNVKGRYTWTKAYHLSLHKTITQLTKGWATDFMVCNLEHFVKPEYSYFEHALSVVEH